MTAATVVMLSALHPLTCEATRSFLKTPTLGEVTHFKHRVEAGSECYNQCDELAKKLIVNQSPYASEIERKREKLR
ncbi:hypothetical protein Pmani_003772 [Petrolisthes manimaculis]|uniref:Uncharacterized protein n=1 Tax=Petrolisthes manimaculis TaxID=1843537 RepID=A0AAE1QFN9_9EUCA|nr:hypothetical protein Pmani_003772 [Petrolisthes manimaculis]